MKLATVRINGQDKVVVLNGDGSGYRLPDEVLGRPVATMRDIISQGTLPKDDVVSGGEYRPFDPDITFLPPLMPPRNIMCVGKNYRAHAVEFTRSGFDSSQADPDLAVPDAPIIFTKAPQTAIGCGASIPYPHGVSESVDYEAELAVVIGKEGRGINRKDASAHIFGYTIINDVTARDLQHRHKQWFLGKSLDGFCPMGPWLVTADEVDAAALDIRCSVNGELRQNANTADLIFDVGSLIEIISAGITLYPGDIIATGTPAGVGIGFTPPRYLQRGDEVAIEISGLGRLANRIV